MRKLGWIAYAKPPFGGSEAVLAYLSPYTHRVAIANSRLISFDDRGVTFTWKDYRTKGLVRKKVMTLTKQHLQDIWIAETKQDAEKAFDFFLEAYGPKYDKAAACLAKDRDVLLTFYDFPAEHWKHIRTTNPIESTFATVRLRTTKTKGCLSRKTALTMVFKLCQSASKKWRRLDGSHHLAEIIRGVKFKDGEKLTERAA